MKASQTLLNTKEVKCSGFREKKVDGITQYCVLGLLGKEAGCCSEEYMYVPACDILIESAYGLQSEEKVKCPECGARGWFLQILAHLNNDYDANAFEREYGHHGWTFKQIGQWLKNTGY